MEFIVEQQAQFTADIQKLQEAQARTDQIVNRLASATLNRFEATDKRVEDIDERIAALVGSQVRTEENVRKTDENLRNLIAVVDRYVNEGGNGNAKE
ncbi:MAG: hypothetical protein ABR577_00125 [Pyrinomonadaceae bacterium]